MVKIIFSNILFEQGISFRESNGSKISVLVEGHAEFGKRGNDIVCSAISILSQTMLIAISRIIQIPQKVTGENGYLKTEIDVSVLSIEDKSILKVILDFFCIGIFEILKKYPDSIDISFNMVN